MNIPCCEGRAIYKRCTCSANRKRYRKLCERLGVVSRERFIAECDFAENIKKLEALAARRGIS